MKKNEVNLTEQVIPKHQFLFVDNDRNRQVEDYILTGGRSSAKSSVVSIYGDYIAVSETTAIVFMRKNHNKLKQTVFAESKRAFSRLGLSLSRDTITTQTPMKIHVKETKSTIYFTGSDNPDDTKGMIDENTSISLVIVDEITEFFKQGYDKGKEELENIKATFVRGNNGTFKMIYLFNPPKNPNHAVMKWLEEKKYLHNEEGERIGLNPRTRHVHTTYLDTPGDWQGKRLLESANAMKEQDLDYYRHIWLGESIGIEEVIFYMFDKDKHVNEYKGQKLVNIGIGVDYGQMNATTFDAFGIDRKERVLQGIKAYKHSGRESKQKSPSEYAEDMLTFVKDVEKAANDRVKFIVIDPSAKGLAEEIKRVLSKNGYNIPIRPAQNAVAEGISRVQILLIHEAMKLDVSMKGAIEEFGIYAYDEKAIERGEEKPIKDNDHDMDAIRYLVMEQYTYMKRLIPTLESE